MKIQLNMLKNKCEPFHSISIIQQLGVPRSSDEAHLLRCTYDTGEKYEIISKVVTKSRFCQLSAVSLAGHIFPRCIYLLSIYVGTHSFCAAQRRW